MQPPKVVDDNKTIRKLVYASSFMTHRSYSITAVVIKGGEHFTKQPLDGARVLKCAYVHAIILFLRQNMLKFEF